MKTRTLVTRRLYFGIEAMTLRAATARVLSRVVGLPPERARVSRRALRQDFELDTVLGGALVNEFVAEGLLQPDAKGGTDDFWLTDRFVEFASARVVEPLPRARAKQLLSKACELAAQTNLEWTRNALEISALAPFGAYMSRDSLLAELPIGIVVRSRSHKRRARFGRINTRPDSAGELRAAFRDLSSFVRVHMVNDLTLVPRPFSVVFQQD
jgi:hypothetical protein